jgi:protein SCO1/2
MTARYRRASGRALAAAFLCAAAAARAQSTAQLRREVAAVGVAERLGAAVPRDAAFTDAEGRTTTLAAMAGRPLLLSFNYTSCPKLCGLQLSGLARALRDEGWRGDRFGIATVSIDPAERPDQLARYKEGMVHQAGGDPGVERGWAFLRGPPAAVDALADAVGFRYRYDARTGEFAHQATLVVLTGDGRVSGYLHGISYSPAALREAVARAASGGVATAAEQRSLGGFLLTCMGFDPADHTPLAMKVMRSGGIAALTFLLSFLGWLALRDRRRRREGGLP